MVNNNNDNNNSLSLSLLLSLSQDLPVDVSKWTVSDVTKFFEPKPDCLPIMPLLEDQEIDGQALLLLSQDTMVKCLGIKLGPALKVTKDCIEELICFDLLSLSLSDHGSCGAVKAAASYSYIVGVKLAIRKLYHTHIHTCRERKRETFSHFLLHIPHSPYVPIHTCNYNIIIIFNSKKSLKTNNYKMKMINNLKGKIESFFSYCHFFLDL